MSDHHIYFNSRICSHLIIKSIKVLFLALFLMPHSVGIFAQDGPRAHYNFDNMDLTEKTGEYLPGQVIDNISYDCGVGFGSSALVMDGSPDTVTLDPAVKELFVGDFSLGFYFWADAGIDSYTLMSIQDNCERDSSLNIRYTSVNADVKEISIEYAADPAEIVRFLHRLDPLKCWHQVTFTKQGDIYSLYVNGRFIESVTFVDPIRMGRNHKVHLGYSDCVGRFDEFYSGRIDEVEIYDYAVDEQFLQSRFRRPDSVVSQDTTIFEGDEYQIITASTCAPSVRWSPGVGLDDDRSAFPFAMPSESTTYQVEFDHGTCVSSDSLRISVVKEDDIDCNRLLLPKAFTPNQDDLNDLFGISNDFIISQLDRFEIYDRWGMKLFETSDKSEKWDGMYAGQTLMPGTYVYKIEYTCLNELFQKTGSFSLLK